MPKQTICAFLLEGKVQGVKLRRYVEAAGRHFGVGGYVINTEDGAVWGEAWGSDGIQDFATWIRGEHTPIVYTNIKPTPVGTAYPEKARVERLVVRRHEDEVDEKYYEQFSQFTMVRDDHEADLILKERKEMQSMLAKALAEKESCNVAEGVEIGSWPKH
jgi:acylphosphatase